jgi:hypothetical protein
VGANLGESFSAERYRSRSRRRSVDVRSAGDRCDGRLGVAQTDGNPLDIPGYTSRLRAAGMHVDQCRRRLLSTAPPPTARTDDPSSSVGYSRQGGQRRFCVLLLRVVLGVSQGRRPRRLSRPRFRLSPLSRPIVTYLAGPRAIVTSIVVNDDCNATHTTKFRWTNDSGH